MKVTFQFLIIASFFILFSCEKEVHLDLPKPVPEIIVEASINNRFPTLNYVYLTTSLDYFNIKMDIEGLSGAEVYITEGFLSGNDTVFDYTKTVQMSEVKIYGLPSGFYINPAIHPRQGSFYKLDIYYQNRIITGTTYIPEPTRILKSSYKFEGEIDGNPRARLSIQFFDPAEPSYYRLGYTIGKDSNMLGWGASERIRLLNDEVVNNQLREFNNFQNFIQGDSINIYFARIGRKEYLFWQSFLEVRNSDSPFSTPAQLRSNIKGGIGSFCGYGIDYKNVIIK